MNSISIHQPYPTTTDRSSFLQSLPPASSRARHAGHHPTSMRFSSCAANVRHHVGCPIPLSISRHPPTLAVSPRAGESFSASCVPPSTPFLSLRPPNPLFVEVCHPSTCAVLVLRFFV
jgi:hypothetical protein